MPSPITLCGSISTLAGSLGRGLHEAGYRALGLPFTYVPFEVNDLSGALVGMRALGIRGFGVSQPFKEEVLALLDAVEPLARSIGAVNTVVNDGGRLTGHNTDWIGATRALEEVRTLADAKVLLFGAGGAARAVAFGLRSRGARLTVANRDLARAERVASLTGARAAPLDEGRRAADYDVVINATSLGQAAPATSASESPVPPEALREGMLVLDLVYKPIDTPLLRAARARGATALHGGHMLLHQAAAQFELYTSHPAPLAAMESALHERLGLA